MGSLFSPTIPRYSPVTYSPTISRSYDDNNGAEKPLKEESSPSSEEENSVRDMIRRNARGRNSLIQTSYRGVLTDMNTLSPQRKNLLGE